jgi:hypothetical protein
MADFQHDQSIQGFFVWDVPFLKNDTSLKGKLLGGWSITGNGYWNFDRQGNSVTPGYDSNANNWGGDDYAKVVGDVSYPKTEISGQGDLLYQWFDPAAFMFPNGTRNRTFGPETSLDGLNVLTQLPWRWGVNGGLMKNFRIAGDARLQFRLEVFNLFNHANLNDPNSSVTSSDFGRIRGKFGEGRRMQLGFRFLF